MLCGADLLDGQQRRTDLQRVRGSPGAPRRGRRSAWPAAPASSTARLRAGQVERRQRRARHPGGRRVDRVQPGAVGSGARRPAARRPRRRRRPAVSVPVSASPVGGHRHGVRVEHAGPVADRECGGPGALDEIGQQLVARRPGRAATSAGIARYTVPNSGPHASAAPSSSTATAWSTRVPPAPPSASGTDSPSTPSSDAEPCPHLRVERRVGLHQLRAPSPRRSARRRTRRTAARSCPCSLGER